VSLEIEERKREKGISRKVTVIVGLSKVSKDIPVTGHGGP
jgi:hypothetical protein